MMEHGCCSFYVCSYVCTAVTWFLTNAGLHASSLAVLCIDLPLVTWMYVGTDGSHKVLHEDHYSSAIYVQVPPAS